jgi:glyoxylase-like metal-dependent hydrolase (beta-lactamase superfamily II)
MEGNMAQEIKTIQLSMPFRLGTVNCYLIGTSTGYILVDTGSSNQRAELERELESAGCMPGDLKLILITHGDFDHTGNAAYLRNKFGAKIAMHPDDWGMIERGDMFSNRKRPNLLIRTMMSLLSGFGKKERCAPDVPLDEGYSLSEYGFEAQVIHIPGHSKGSIGVLTTSGDLICGDLFENIAKPVLNSLMDDLEAANVSIKKVKSLEINTVYPGHGEPFPLDVLIDDQRDDNEVGN